MAARLAVALDDRYGIERELGAGGMATVYLAEDLKHDRKVAIKVLKPELAAVLGAERFVQEIKTTAALSHPHILPLFDSGEAGGFLYYVMPYIQGETIREKLNRETQFGIDEAVRITTEVADALDYAHRHGVIHRDIKPENILLHDGRPMVMDFGIALAVSAAAGGRMTETGLSLGTPHYMSPEQATADKQITARSDVYSLASVLYEMLTGEPPHTGASAQAIIMKIIAEPVKPATELRKTVPPNVTAALARALEKLPADRFDSARAFAAALADHGFVGSTRVVAAHGRGTPAGIRTGAMATTVAAVLVVGVALGYMLKPVSPATDQVVRLGVNLPPGTELALEGPGGSALALSPDGAWVALVIRGINRRDQQLYLRRLDRLQLTPVTGAEGAVSPFFSPDSRTLGFIASDGRIRRVDIAGGPVTTVSDRPAGVGSEPAWADDGHIYFRGTDYRIYRVSAAGGKSQLLGDTLLTVRLPGGEVPAVRSFPSPLPGGGRILVSECAEGIIRGNGNCTGRLVMMDVPGGKVTPLPVPASRGWYVQGHLALLSSDGTLSAVEFDAASGTVRGDPVALLDGVGSAVLVRPQVSVGSMGSLAYVPGEGVADRVIVEVDRSGRERVVVARPGPYLWIRGSPDGTRIALIQQEAGQSSQLFVFDKRTGTTSPLTFAGANQRPSWSPDSRRIAFSSSSSRDSVTDVWVVEANGSATARPIAEGKDVQQHTATSWTPDGQWIIIDGLAENGPNAGRDDIYALSVNGDSSLRAIVATPANEQAGEVSPDGRWIAYTSDDAGEPQVYVQPFGRPGGRSLVSDGAAIEPAWASANELIYSSLSTDSLISARLSFGESVGVTRTALFGRSRYTVGIASWREYDVSRDGQRFIFTRTVAAAQRQEPIVVVNWMAEVRAAIAARKVAR